MQDQVLALSTADAPRSRAACHSLPEPSVSISGSRAIAALKLPWLLMEMAKKDMQN